MNPPRKIALELSTAYTTDMQPSDTAYQRFKTRLTQAELEQLYTPTDEELAFCASVTLSPTTRLGFVVLLKTFQ